MLMLHDVIRSMVLAFDRGDSRREDIRHLADLVQELQEAAQQYLEATANNTVVRETGCVAASIRLDTVLKQVNNFAFPEEKKPA
jgi:uncharacterized protein (DUF885 family)